MLNEKITEILKHEGPASFATYGTEGTHLAATWNSYIEVLDNDTLLIPAGHLNKTQRNVEDGSEVQMILASKEVTGLQGKGAGFLLKGKAKFEGSGINFDKLKSRFSWVRSAMVFKVKEITELV
ncbi:MAG: FMN-binding protein [bacterium]